MARWRTGTRERLMGVALDLFATQGFEGTTVAQIAAEAGLTERTFFRHFADKREVLFGGQDDFESGFVDALRACDATTSIDLIAAALAGADDFFSDEHRPLSRARQQVIDQHPQLQERELHKMAALADVLRDELVDRGIDAADAGLVADIGIAAFRRAFAAWIQDDETRPFGEIQRDVIAQMRGLVAG